MRDRPSLLALLAALGSLGGCSVTRGAPFDPALVGQQKYLCCNMGFDVHYAASDANYGQYGVRTHYAKVLAAGTKVTVTKVGASGIAFRAEGDPVEYTLLFAYGRNQLSANQYFADVLRDTNPTESEPPASGVIAIGLSEGQLVPGMTRAQALLTRGYPPAHQTTSLDANVWVYYETPHFVDRVVFVDGRIESITRGPAP